MKYINAEKLIAEIERRIRIKENLAQHPEMSDMKDSLYDIIGAYQSLKSFINYLQQEQSEVDLEKDIEKICDFNKAQTTITMTKGAFKIAAHHFYELGLNTRKEE